MADAYFRERVRLIVIFFIIWFIVSFGVVMFAESFKNMTFNGFPFHYLWGRKGGCDVYCVAVY